MILAMEQLGGGCFNESMSSMLSNLKNADVKIKNRELIADCVDMMRDKKIQGIANGLARMLLCLEKSISTT